MLPAPVGALRVSWGLVEEQGKGAGFLLPLPNVQTISETRLAERERPCVLGTAQQNQACQVLWTHVPATFMC